MQKVIALTASLLPVFGIAAPVNINTAGAEAIAEALTGIGLAKAEAIVRYREENGQFDVPEEILKVKGIGPRVLAANRDDIRVSE